MAENTSLSASGMERVVFLDYLRVIACFMVITVHCIEPFYLGGEGTLIRNMTDAAWSTFLDSALRAAVPLFVMASSYLLFPLKYDTATFFKKRFVRVCIPLIIWSLLYALIPYYGSAEGFDRGANLGSLLLNFNPHSGHLCSSPSCCASGRSAFTSTAFISGIFFSSFFSRFIGWNCLELLR